jgi:hypothetical protein
MRKKSVDGSWELGWGKSTGHEENERTASGKASRPILPLWPRCDFESGFSTQKQHFNHEVHEGQRDKIDEKNGLCEFCNPRDAL